MPKYTTMYKPSGVGPMLVVEGDEKRYEEMGWTRAAEDGANDFSSESVIDELLAATKDLSLDEVKNLGKVAILGMLSKRLQNSPNQELVDSKNYIVSLREQEIRDAD